MKLQKCVALVTGANRGLGRALVSALVEAGAAKVYAAARNEALVEQGVPLRLDLSRPETIAEAARVAGEVTLLINNAGSFTSFAALETSPAALDADFRTNVQGMLAMIRAFAPRLAPGSTVVNVLSLTSLASVPLMGGYSASKAAAYSLTQALRPELKKRGIALLAALPGPIDTDMVRALQLPKTAPADVAREIVRGIVEDQEEIFPDPMAQQMGALWAKSPKDLERAFASL